MILLFSRMLHLLLCYVFISSVYVAWLWDSFFHLSYILTGMFLFIRYASLKKDFFPPYILVWCIFIKGLSITIIPHQLRQKLDPFSRTLRCHLKGHMQLKQISNTSLRHKHTHTHTHGKLFTTGAGLCSVIYYLLSSYNGCHCQLVTGNNPTEISRDQWHNNLLLSLTQIQRAAKTGWLMLTSSELCSVAKPSDYCEKAHCKYLKNTRWRL